MFYICLFFIANIRILSTLSANDRVQRSPTYATYFQRAWKTHGWWNDPPSYFLSETRKCQPIYRRRFQSKTSPESLKSINKVNYKDPWALSKDCKPQEWKSLKLNRIWPNMINLEFCVGLRPRSYVDFIYSQEFVNISQIVQSGRSFYMHVFTLVFTWLISLAVRK